VKSKKLQFLLFIPFVVCLTISARAQDAEALRQRVLQASHLTRINDADMKPWHLKVSFQLYDPKGKPSDQGTFEEWWAGPMLWKSRTESPSYTATVIENREGHFRTVGSDRIRMQTGAILGEFLYPMPMAEDLSRMRPHLRHETIQNTSLDCIELKFTATVVPSPIFCLDPMTNVLRETHSSKSRRGTFRNKIEDFQGRSVALSVTARLGKSNTATAEVIDLSEISMTEGLFSPSQDMEKVTDMRSVKITVK
jgi:hypothetical protein